jgi:hypothetical protein
MDTVKILMSKKCYYSSVVHCNYYSSFQLMKHVVINKFRISNNQIFLNSKNNTQSTHEYLINLMFLNLSRINVNEALDFQSSILQLKQLRSEADYEEKITDKNICETSILLNQLINNILKTTYKI